MVKWRTPARLIPCSFESFLFRQHGRTFTTYSTIAGLLHPKGGDAPSIGDTIRVNGFVRSVRKQKTFAFAAIGDGSTLKPLQAVLTPDQAEGLSTGTSVTISGSWQASPKGKEQAAELHAHDIHVLGYNDAAGYPIQKKYHSPEFLRTLPHLRARTPLNALLLRLRSHVISSLTRIFDDMDFVQTHTPMITSSDCEGGGEVFEVTAEPSQPLSKTKETRDSERHPPAQFFHHTKYLTVSSQLHLEALAQSVSRVWTLSPSFRAERSDTPRHLSEFYMLEAELAFTNDLETIMALVETLIRRVTQDLRESRVGTELLAASSRDSSSSQLPVGSELLTARWEGLMKETWPRITYEKAIETLQRDAAARQIDFETMPSFHEGLRAEHERYLAKCIGQGSPVFVTDYPQAMKAFYMLPSMAQSRDTPLASCFDLLVPDICELAGGSLREHRMVELEAAMRRHGVASVADPKELADSGGGTRLPDPDDASKSNGNDSERLQWYADLRRFGSVPHGGFGIGFDRLLAYLSGVSSVRDVVSFPRWYGRCDC